MKRQKERGFTLVELLIGSAILLVVIIITMTLYMRSNRIAVDQQQFTDIQHDVRSAMYFLSRDIQNAGVGLGTQISGYFLEGTDAHGPIPEYSDSLKVIGNFEMALNITIEEITGVNAQLADGTLANLPYDCPEDLENKTVLLVSNSCEGCFAFRYIDTGRVNGCEGGNESIQFLPSSGSGLNPPGGMKDTGCDNDCWDGATLTFGEVRYFWLDTSGNPGDYSDLSLVAGEDGYLGVPYTFYLTSLNDSGSASHTPLALNIESLQFQYNGDLDDDGTLDGFVDWDNSNWTILSGDDEATKQAKRAIINKIREVKVWVLGKTGNPYVSFTGTPTAAHLVYRRPTIANVTGASTDDNHRRFLLETTATVRNLELNMYHTGNR